VLDDFFPNLLTGFRVAEYNALLERFPGLEIASSYGEFERVHAEYAARYPRHAGRVVAFRPGFCAGAELAYLNFLNNAVQFLPELERERVPFVLTLYPGGGFGIDEPESDGAEKRERQALQSPDHGRGVTVDNQQRQRQHVELQDRREQYARQGGEHRTQRPAGQRDPFGLRAV
jgi:lipopolysaccharide transport system ATP-binding protein